MKLIQEALQTNLIDGLTIDEIVDWIRIHRRSFYDEVGQDELGKQIQGTLGRQKNRIKPKVWECADGKWRLSEAWLGEQRMDKAGEGSISTPAVSGRHSTEGVGIPDTHENVSQRESPYVPVTESADEQDVRVIAVGVHHENEQSDTLPTRNQDGEPCSRDPPWKRSSEARVCAEPDGQVATIDGPATRDRLSEYSEIASAERSRQEGRVIATALDSAPLQQGTEQVTEVTRNLFNQVDCAELDYRAIVLELQQRKQERKTQEAKIEACRNALPNIDALTANAEQARVREAELVRLLEEARGNAQSAEEALEDALSRQSQLRKDEQELQNLTRRSEVLRCQLDID